MKFADLSPGMLVREGATLLKVLHVYTDHYGTARQVTLQRLLIERKPKRPLINLLVHLVPEDLEERRLDEPTSKQLKAMKVYYG